MGFRYRRQVKLGRNTWANLSTRGVSLSHRRGRTTVNSRGGLWVRLGKGLSYRGKLW